MQGLIGSEQRLDSRGMCPWSQGKSWGGRMVLVGARACNPFTPVAKARAL